MPASGARAVWDRPRMIIGAAGLIALGALTYASVGWTRDAEVERAMRVFGVDESNAERIAAAGARLRPLLRDPRLRMRATDEALSGLQRARLASRRGLARMSPDQVAAWWRVQRTLRSESDCCVTLLEQGACTDADIGRGLYVLSDEELNTYFDLLSAAGLAELDEAPIAQLDQRAYDAAEAEIAHGLDERAQSLFLYRDSTAGDERDQCRMAQDVVGRALDLDPALRDAFLRARLTVD